MKRLFVVGVACAALLAPSLASGSVMGSGSVSAKGGFDMGFDFTVNSRGKPKKVKDFFFTEIQADCEVNGPVGFEASGLGPYDVNRKRKFGDKINVNWKPTKRGNPGTITVKGQYNRRITKAEGIIRATGDLGDNTGCDTGKAEWVAGLIP
jgi:hypothetical protein